MRHDDERDPEVLSKLAAIVDDLRLSYRDNRASRCLAQQVAGDIALILDVSAAVATNLVALRWAIQDGAIGDD